MRVQIDRRTAEPTLKIRTNYNAKKRPHGPDYPKQRLSDGLGSMNVSANRVNFLYDLVKFSVPLFRLVLKGFHGFYKSADGFLHVHDGLKRKIVRG